MVHFSVCIVSLLVLGQLQLSCGDVIELTKFHRDCNYIELDFGPNNGDVSSQETPDNLHSVSFLQAFYTSRQLIIRHVC